MSVNLAAREVTLPQRVLNHSDDLTKLIWSENTSDYGHLSTLSLLKHIGGRLAPEAAIPLQPLIDTAEARTKKPTVKMCPAHESLEFGYDFGLKKSRTASRSSQSTRTSPSESPRGHQRHRSKDEGWREPRVEVSPKKPVMVVSETSEKDDDKWQPTSPQYAITVETLAFVKQRMPLLAAMMHLLCPSPSSPTGARASSRATAGGEGEEESGDEESMREERREKEREKDREADDGGRPLRMALLKSLRGDRSAPPPVVARKRLSISSYDLLPQQPWQRQFEDVLIHFVDFPVLRNYLLTRMMSFESVLPWDPPDTSADAHPPKREKQRRSSLQGLMSLRQIALLPATSAELGEACCYIVHKLLDAGMVNEAVRFLSSEPALAHMGSVGFMADLALASAFVKSYLEVLSVGQGGEGVREKKTASMDPISLLSRLSDPELAARLALSSLHNWPASVCSAMLSYCLHHLPPSSPLLPPLSEKLHRMAVYERVMETCESPLRLAGSIAEGDGVGGRGVWHGRSPWGSWSELAADSESKPAYVLQILLESKAFALARRWAYSHNLSPDITQVHCMYVHCMCTFAWAYAYMYATGRDFFNLLNLGYKKDF